MSLTSAGCRAGLECTLIGCEDGITAEIGAGALATAEGTVVVETCLEDRCQTQTFPPDETQRGLVLIVPVEGLQEGDNPSVAIVVTDESQEVLVEHEEEVALRSIRPNGPGCGPICVVGEVRVGDPRSGG